MKKLFLLPALIACFGLAACGSTPCPEGVTWQIVGSLQEPSAWNNNDENYLLTMDTEKCTYSITLDVWADEEFQFVHPGTWDGQLGFSSVDTEKSLPVDGMVSAAGGGSIENIKCANSGNYTFTIDGKTSKVTYNRNKDAVDRPYAAPLLAGETALSAVMELEAVEGKDYPASKLEGQTVTVRASVLAREATAYGGYNYYIERNGTMGYLYSTNASADIELPELGDYIAITAKISTYNGLVELTTYNVEGAGVVVEGEGLGHDLTDLTPAALSANVYSDIQSGAKYSSLLGYYKADTLVVDSSTITAAGTAGSITCHFADTETKIGIYMAKNDKGAEYTAFAAWAKDLAEGDKIEVHSFLINNKTTFQLAVSEQIVYKTLN